MLFQLFLLTFLVHYSFSAENCDFEVHKITESSSFPSSCSVLTGRFLIDENSQLSDAQLASLFKNVNDIQGVLQIWNTSLTSITFTKNLKTLSGDPLDKMISILNNTQLKSISLSSLSDANGRVLIQKNPLLDLKSSCNTLHSVFFNRRFISENLFDCGCELRGPFKEAKNFPEDCVILYGNIQIEGSPPSFAQLYRLETVQALYGSIKIIESNLESLGFLQNLREIESDPESEYIFEITRNSYLGRLDLVSLSSIKSRYPTPKIYIKYNYDLCVDPAFVQLAARSNADEVDIDATFCRSNFINNPSTYCYGNLSSVNDRCTKYIGNLMYFNNDQFFMYQENFNYTKVPQNDLKKMKQFEIIFGTIYIEGSNLTTFSLPNLQEIYQVADVSPSYARYPQNYVLALKNNYQLKSVSFPKLKIAYKMIYFDANTNLTTDDDFCRRITNGTMRMILGTTGEYDCRPGMAELTTLPAQISTTTEEILGKGIS